MKLMPRWSSELLLDTVLHTISWFAGKPFLASEAIWATIKAGIVINLRALKKVHFGNNIFRF